MSVTDTGGTPAVSAPTPDDDRWIAKLPAYGIFDETTANRIEPSGQRTFTSVCVGSEPIWTPSAAAPCGSARPKVAQPAVKLYRASAVSAFAVRAENTASIATLSAPRRRIRIMSG